MVHLVQDQAPNNFSTPIKSHFGALVLVWGPAAKKASFLRMILQAKVLNAQIFLKEFIVRFIDACASSKKRTEYTEILTLSSYLRVLCLLH